MYLRKIFLSPEGDGGGGGGEGAGGAPAGGAPAGGGGGFDFEKWDGKPESLPDDNARNLFSAFSKRQEQAARDNTGRQLIDHVRRSFQQPAPQPAPQRQPQPGQQPQRPPQPQPGQGQGEPRYLTEDDLARREQMRQLEERRASWARGFEDLVAKPAKFGNATVTFSSPQEIDDFNAWIKDTMGRGGLTPQDMLFIYRREQILNSHGEAAVKAFEERLKQNGKPAPANGNAGGKPAPAAKKPPANDGDRAQRVPDTETWFKENNPHLYNQIISGDVKPF